MCVGCARNSYFSFLFCNGHFYRQKDSTIHYIAVHSNPHCRIWKKKVTQRLIAKLDPQHHLAVFIAPEMYVRCVWAHSRPDGSLLPNLHPRKLTGEPQCRPNAMWDFFNCCYSIIILTDNLPSQHTFHETCLLAARRWKSECPLCRSALSPVLQQLQWAQSNTMPGREEIVQAANRARNAVRYYKALLKCWQILILTLICFVLQACYDEKKCICSCSRINLIQDCIF